MPLASRGPSDWISNAGALRAPFVRVDIAPDLHESRIAMRTSIGDEAMRALSPSIGRRVSPRRSDAVLRVARVIEEQRRALAVLLRLGRLHLDGDDRAQELRRAARRSAASRLPVARRRGASGCRRPCARRRPRRAATACRRRPCRCRPRSRTAAAPARARSTPPPSRRAARASASLELAGASRSTLRLGERPHELLARQVQAGHARQVAARLVVGGARGAAARSRRRSAGPTARR